MSKKVYLSPSDQKNNAYAYGNTTEAIQCGKIAEACKAALERSGVEVMVGQYDTMGNRCAASDAFGANLHVPIHTNAYNGKVSGTRMFCYESNGEGYKACKAIFDVLAPYSPGTSENIKVNADLYEVRVPAAPTAYIEVDFHDVPSVAKWIVENTTGIGEKIARGICKYLNVKFVSPKAKEKPAEEPKADTEQVLYRVQVGAFANRANADRMLEKLKAAGFAGFVVKGSK